MQRTSDVTAGPVFSPLAESADWLPFKDAVYGLVTGRGPKKSPHTLGDELDRALVRRLARLRVSPTLRPALVAAVFDLGSDVGRYVYARFVPEGVLAPALEVLGRATAQSGLCEMGYEVAFLREASITIKPTDAASPADPDVLAAFVAGILHGALADTFNCVVRISSGGRNHLELALGEGRDVNKELTRRG